MLNLNPFKFPIRYHFLFWLVIAGAVITGQFVQIITLFAIVMIHELGHVVMAKTFSFTIKELVIFPFGGMLHLYPNGKENPWEELWIAVAGPVTNGILILCALLFLKADLWSLEWTLFFISGNVHIALFNLLPIYPLDGGRIVQVFLTFVFPFRKAILISIILGMFVILAILFLSFTFLNPSVQLWMILPYLMVILWFEYRKIPFRFLTFLLTRFNKKHSRFLPSVYIPVEDHLSLNRGAERMYRTRYHVFRVHSIQGEKKPKYYGEKRVLREMFERKRPMATFAEMDKE